MKDPMSIESVVDEICENLGIRQKHLASFLNFSEEALSRVKKEAFRIETNTKISRRLSALVYAMRPLLEVPLEPKARVSVLRTLAFDDSEGNRDSVFSALKQDKYQKELLEQITRQAYKIYCEKIRSKNKLLQIYARKEGQTA